MSFSLTKQKIRDRSMDVNRRFGWLFLKPGNKLCAVETALGLRRDKKIKRLCMIEVVGTRSEP